MFVMPACFNVGDTVYFEFDTFDSNGASVTITGLAVTDIECFKNGSTTTRSSDNGYALLDTDGIDFGGRVGIHGFSINTGDNSDADFWADGAQYFIVVDAVTVDSQTVRFTYLLPLGFSLRPTTAGRTLDVAATGEAGVDLGNVTGTLTQANVGWVDANSRVDVGQWLGTAPLGLSSQRVQVDVQAIDGLASAATVLGLWLAEGVQTVADSGTTTTIVDAVLTQADGYWNGALLIFRTGTNAGRTAIITDFDAATDTLTFAPAVPDAVTTEGYVLVPGLGHADITAISQDATAADNLELQYDTTGLTGATFPATQSQVNRNADLIESQRGSHTWQGNYYYVDPVNGDTHASGNRGGRADPYKTIQDCHDNAVTDNNHDVIFLVSGAASGATTHTVAATTTLSKNYVFIRGPGRNFIITRTGSGDTIAVSGDGVEISGVRIGTAATGSGDGIDITDADFARIHHCWFLDTRGDGVHILRGSNCQIHDNDFDGTGVAGSGDGIHIIGTAGSSNHNTIFDNEMHGVLGDAILIEQGTTNDTLVYGNDIHDSGGWGINIGASSTRAVVYNNVFGNNSSGDITDAGTSSIIKNNVAWLYSTTENRSLDVNATGEAGLDLDNTSGTIDAAQIGADAITAAKIADDAIAAEHLATGVFTADAFAANALVAATFAASSLVGKGDWNTVVPDAAGTASTLHTTTDALITGISNVTRLSVAIPTYLERPPSGDKAIKVSVALKDTDGNMEDPDGNQLALLLANSGGTSRNSLLYKDFALTTALDAGSGTFSTFKALERTSTGLYFCYFKVAFDATEEEWLAQFGWEEGAVALYEFRATQVTDAANDLGVLLTRCSEVRMAELGSANLPADIDLILEDTGTTLPAQITALENLSSAGAQAAADAALVANHLDHLFKTDYDPASKPGTATALLNELIESNAGVSRYTAAALAQAPSGSGGDATASNQTTIITHLTDVKGTAFAKDTDSLIDLAHTGADGDTLKDLSDQLDGLGALSGEGAYTGTLTVDDGSTGLEGAVVNARRGGVLKASGTTDASGEITNWVFGAFTYDLAARLSGYEPETDTIAVSADAWSKTISLTANTISAPPNASTTTGVMTVYDEEGSVEQSVSVSVQIIDGPGTDGIGYDSTVWTETSSALGVVEFAGIILGARYKIWRGTAKAAAETFVAPTTGDSFDLAEVIGRG